MVWRNDKGRIRRRLPSIPSEPETFRPTLSRLNLRSMLQPIFSDDVLEQPTLLEVDDDNVEQLSLSEHSRQSWTPNVKLTFPVHSTQRRELPIEEDIESSGTLDFKF